MLMALFTEERKDWEKELQKHCDGVYVDPEETKEEQEMKILKYKKKKTNSSRKMVMSRK